MTERIEIEPCGPLDAAIRPPGSKSVTNRALVCAALADGTSTLRGVLDSEDTRVMIDGLRRLGFAVESSGDTATVTGGGGLIPAARAELFVANSGTTIRFLTSLATLGEGEFRLDGSQRMRQRPIGELVRALRQLGGDVESEGDCPPVTIRATGLTGGAATLRGDISSQYLSGLLMAAAAAQSDVTISVEGPLVSRPYVDMTIALMDAFGARVEETAPRVFRLPAPQRYSAREYEIEPDASAASYFWAAAAIAGGRVKVEGLAKGALQGDVRFCDCLAKMGCDVEYGDDFIAVTGGPLQGIDTDMNEISDTVQTLAAVALFAEGPTTIRGVAHNRHKETDRITDLARELRKVGGKVEEAADGLRIVPGKLHSAEIETYNDHRMAMSLSLVGLRVPGVVILDPGCTAKTYPRFFEDLERVRRQSRPLSK